MQTGDPMELKVAEALTAAGIKFVHESDDNSTPLDFWLPDYRCYIEVKRFATERIAKQMTYAPDIIVIQGWMALQMFIGLLTAKEPV